MEGSEVSCDTECDPKDLYCTECCDVCPPVFKSEKVARLGRPAPAVTHLNRTELHQAYRDYALLPYAPYPPGGVPTGGDPDLRVSSEEWARRAKESDCYKCHVRQDVKRASKLELSWMFWVGLGAGALGAMTLVLTRK